MAALSISLKFPQRRAFITGAGSGLGAALARALAVDGWTLGLNDRQEDPVRATADAVVQLGGKAHVYAFDVTDRVAFASSVTQFLDLVGGVDLVVNNAGVAVGGLVGETLLEDWDWIIGINYVGVVNGCHFFAPVLKRQGAGHLLNISSAASFVPVPKMAAYCSTKSAVKMLSEVLYNELHEHGVGVSALMPEFFRTNIIDNMRGPEKEQAHFILGNAPYSAEQVAAYALAGVARGKLHIVFGRQAKLIWRLVRWMPALSMGLLRADARRLEATTARQIAAQRRKERKGEK